MQVFKLIKNNIIGIVVGFVIAGSITAGAVTMFASSDVSYDSSESGASATTVKEALDELYGMVPEYYHPYFIGNTVYYNPVSGSKCFDYVSDNSLNENVGETTDTQCMKWYIIGEDTDTIDMILDHNTTYTSYWNSEGTNESGPAELLTELNSDTSGWTGVTARTDTYTDPAYGYTINYSGYRARLIEANEIAELTGADKAIGWDSALLYNYSGTIGRNTWYYYMDGKYGTDSTWKTQVATSQGASKYAWLFDYTNECNSYGCNITDNKTWGYWTSSAVFGYSDRSWRVSHVGDVYPGSIVTDVNYNGLRPVITIPKP